MTAPPIFRRLEQGNDAENLHREDDLGEVRCTFLEHAHVAFFQIMLHDELGPALAADVLPRMVTLPLDLPHFATAVTELQPHP